MATHGSFMKSLFFGVIDDGVVFPYPRLSESEATAVHALIGNLRRFADKQVDSAAIDRDARITPEVLRGLRELGLFGLLAPKEHGGSGLGATAFARVVQELAGVDPALAITVGAHQSIGYLGLLLFGTDAQKARYLPRLATGEMVAAFALSEAHAGSDAAAIQTRAEPVQGGFLLNGSKVWVTNGELADFFTVFARTSPADDGAKPRLTAFIVERKFGIKTGKNQPKLGIRGCSVTELSLSDVRVPDENVLGEIGRGFMVAMGTLNSGRLALASGCVGLAKELIRLTTERCTERRAFGRPIGQFGLVKDKVATMLAETYALESMTYLTTSLVDNNVDYSIESAICKVYGSEALWRVANEALQVAAGVGYMADRPFERLLRDARVNLIFEGTNEILRCFIALSGMASPGQALVDVARAMREPIKGFGLLSDFAMRKARSALGRERILRAHPVLNREAVVFEEYAAELAKAVDKALRKHGKNIAEMQYTQRRIADMAIDLFAIAAVLSRTSRTLEREGEEGARRDVALTMMFVNAAEKRLAATTLSFDKNDDELRKSIADRAYVDGGYPFDVT